MGKFNAKSFVRDESGSMLVVAGFGFVVALGFAALAVDMSHMYVLRNQLQTTADAAAEAAVSQLPDSSETRTVAQSIVAQNLPVVTHGKTLTSGDIIIGEFDAKTKTVIATATAPTAVQVTVRRTRSNNNPAPTFFGNVLGVSDMDISAVAIAGPGRGPFCLVALAPSGTSIRVDSGSGIEAAGCVLHANSTDGSAINSSGQVNAKGIKTVGGVNGSGYSTSPETGVDPIPDPLGGLPPPANAGDPCDFTKTTVKTSKPLSPGVYCEGLKIDDSADVTFDPGVYIIRGGNLQVGSGSSISGTGVSFYLTGSDATLNLDNGSSADLSAPVSGPMAGILFFQDRNAATGNKNGLDSGTNSVFAGTIYLPNGELNIGGGANVSQNSPFSSIVARTVNVDTSSTLVLNSNYSSSSVPVPKGLAARNAGLLR